ERLELRTEHKQLRDAAHAVVEQLTGGFVSQYSFSDAYPYKFARDARAISICFPESSNLEGTVPGQEVHLGSYKDLTFSQKTKWPSFLTEFWKTQRAAGDRRKVLAKAAG